MHKRIVILLIVGLTQSTSIYAKNLGERGPVYPVQEKNLLVLIHEKLSEMNASGQTEQINQKMLSDAKKKVTRPTPVSGLSSATNKRAWAFDPTLTVNKDIQDHLGNVIARKGQSVNPLGFVKLDKNLVFINSDDKKELKFAVQLLKKDNQKIKIILVKGSVSDVSEMLNMPIYFDQQGLLTERFGIKHTPAMVSQKGKALFIEEIAL